MNTKAFMRYYHPDENRDPERKKAFFTALMAEVEGI
jgi:hypothetical protein